MCSLVYITPIHTNGCTIFVKTLTDMRQYPTIYPKFDVNLILTLTLKAVLINHTQMLA